MSKMMNVCVAPTMEEAEADLRAIGATKGWNEEIINMVKAMVIFGDPDTVGERMVEVLNTGIDGMTINMPPNGHIPGRVTLCGEVATAALKSAGK